MGTIDIRDFDIDKRYNRFGRKYFRIEHNGMYADFTESYHTDFIEDVIDEPNEENLTELARLIEGKSL